MSRPVTPGRAAATATGAVVDAEPPTTAGVIAVGNLQAQIAGQAREATAGRLDASGQGELVELLLLRGHLLGSIADYDERSFVQNWSNATNAKMVYNDIHNDLGHITLDATKLIK